MRVVQRVPIREATYSSVSINELMRVRLPVKLSGFSIPETNILGLDQGSLLEALQNHELAGARLKNGTLDLSADSSFSISTFRGSRILADSDLLKDFYFSEPLSNLPADVLSLIPYPFACNQFLWSRGRLWIAGAGSRTPIHRDIPHNLILVTEGEKDVPLVAAENSTVLRPNSVFSKAPNFAATDIRDVEPSGAPKELSLNLYHTVLRAGEIIYIPPFWWHDIKNLTQVTSINYWFAPAGLISMLAMLSYAAKRLLGIYKHEWRSPVPADS